MGNKSSKVDPNNQWVIDLNTFDNSRYRSDLAQDHIDEGWNEIHIYGIPEEDYYFEEPGSNIVRIQSLPCKKLKQYIAFWDYMRSDLYVAKGIYFLLLNGCGIEDTNQLDLRYLRMNPKNIDYILTGVPLLGSVIMILSIYNDFPELFMVAYHFWKSIDDEAIITALTKGSSRILDMILERVDPNRVILLASKYGVASVVFDLLSNPKITQKSLDVSMVNASSKGHIEVVRFLLMNRRADPLFENNHAFIKAVMNGHTEIVKIFLEDRRAQPHARNNAAIREACILGYVEIVRLLLNDPRVDPMVENYSPLFEAFNHSHLEIIEILLADPRVDPTARSNAPIRFAAVKGYTEIVRDLLQNPQVDPSANNNEAIIMASKGGYNEIVGMLLEDLRVDPTANRNEALRYASKNGRTEVVRTLLIDGRVDPNDMGGISILSAINHDHREVVRLLMYSPRTHLTRFMYGELLRNGYYKDVIEVIFMRGSSDLSNDQIKTLLELCRKSEHPLRCQELERIIR